MRLKRPFQVAGGDKNPMGDRQDGVRESRQDGLEKSRLFTRTLHLHDPHKNIHGTILYRIQEKRSPGDSHSLQEPMASAICRKQWREHAEASQDSTYNPRGYISYFTIKPACQTRALVSKARAEEVPGRPALRH